MLQFVLLEVIVQLKIQLGHRDAVNLDKFNVSAAAASIVWLVIDARRLSCAIIQKVSSSSWRIASAIYSHLSGTSRHMSSLAALRAILVVPPDPQTQADHVRAGDATLPPTPSKDPHLCPLTKVGGGHLACGHPSVNVGSEWTCVAASMA